MAVDTSPSIHRFFDISQHSAEGRASLTKQSAGAVRPNGIHWRTSHFWRAEGGREGSVREWIVCGPIELILLYLYWTRDVSTALLEESTGGRVGAKSAQMGLF